MGVYIFPNIEIYKKNNSFISINNCEVTSTPVGENVPGFQLVDREDVPVPDVRPVYDGAMMELTYQHRQDQSPGDVHYWKLPDQFLGLEYGKM